MRVRVEKAEQETYDLCIVGTGPAAVSYTHLDVYKRQILKEVIHLNGSQRAKILYQGKLNAARFDTDKAIASYEQIYSQAMTV